jgi:hypothetical protein
MSGIPAVSLERTFGPSRTGADKTGWVCESRAQILLRHLAGSPSVGSAEHYTCVCKAETCFGIGIVEGKHNEQHKGLQRSVVRTNYAPGRTGSEATGWQCRSESGAALEEEAEPAPGNERGAASGWRHACTCTRPRCGGQHGIIEGDQGQRHSGIPESQLDLSYGSVQYGQDVTGWVCRPESPPPPPPRFRCTCSRESCGGADGITPGDRGQIHASITEARLHSSYSPARSGEQDTGWVCMQEPSASARAMEPARPGPRREATRGEVSDRELPPGRHRGSIDLLFGAALGIGAQPHMGALVLKPGIALNERRTLSLILPLQAQLLSASSVLFAGLGLQYDVELATNLYLTPRFSLGYAASLLNQPEALVSSTVHLGHFTPELGLKYVLAGRVHLGIDLASIPIVFDRTGSGASYRLMALLGVGL